MAPRLILGAALVALVATAAPSTARADELDDLLLEQGPAVVTRVGTYMVSRFRRATALGPTAAVAGSRRLSGDGPGFAGEVAFGLALERYDVPLLPVREIVQALARQAFTEALRSFAAGSAPTPDERRAIATRALQEVERKLVAGELGGHFEPPALKVAVEVAHELDGGPWQIRPWLGYGVSRVFVAVAPVIAIDDGVHMIGALELAMPILFGGLRTHVIEPFARLDVPVTARDSQDLRLALGVRFMLDAI